MVGRGSIKSGPSPRHGGGRSGAGPCLAAAGCCLGFFLLNAVAAATAPSQDLPLLTQPLRHQVSVVLKLLQVSVTDKKGRPVEDLTLEDFAVTDDGQPVVLTDFERHVLRAAPEEASMAKPEPAAAVGSAPALTRKFFLFFDFAFNTGRGLVKARTAALRFLDDKVGPGDEVGILTYSMFKGVRVHEFLSRDHAKVRELVAVIGSKDIAGRASELELQYWTMAQEPLAGAGGAGELAAPSAGKPVTDPNRDTRTESKRIAQTYVLRLTALAKALRSVPGQKNLVLFSTGVPSSIIYGGQAGNPSSGAGRATFDAGDRVLRTQNEEMAKEFGAAGCALYAFDTRESAKEANLFAYDSMTFESGSRGLAGTQGVFQDSTDVFRDDKTTGLNSLKRLADVTGGKFFANINMYERNLEQVKGLTGTYYVLGYSIGEREDGRFHEVKVAVKRPGYEVRTQSGYFSPKPFAEMTKLEKDLHLYDLALNERSLARIPANVPVTTLSFNGAEGGGLEVVAKVPGEVTEQFSGGRVEYIVLCFDAKNDIRGVRRVETDPRPSRGQAIAFTSETSLPPGDYTCRLVIRDMDTGLSAVGSARASVRESPPEGLRLGTPLLVREEGGYARLDTGVAKGRTAFPWREVYTYDQTSLSPIGNRVSRLTSKLTAIVPYAVPGTAEPDVAFSARLIDAVSGQTAPVEFILAGSSWHSAAQTVRLEFPIAGLAPGSYILYISAEDRASKTLAHVQTGLVITED